MTQAIRFLVRMGCVALLAGSGLSCRPHVEHNEQAKIGHGKTACWANQKFALVELANMMGDKVLLPIVTYVSRLNPEQTVCPVCGEHYKFNPDVEKWKQGLRIFKGEVKMDDDDRIDQLAIYCPCHDEHKGIIGMCFCGGGIRLKTPPDWGKN